MSEQGRILTPAPSLAGLRIARMVFPAEVAFSVIMGASHGPSTIKGDGAPADLKLLGHRYNLTHNIIELIVTSESFKPFLGEPGREPVIPWNIEIDLPKPVDGLEPDDEIEEPTPINRILVN